MKRPMSSDRFKTKEGLKIKTLIYIMIDLFKIKEKINNSINNKNNNEILIPVDFGFFENFLLKNNLLNLYQNKNLNSMINKSNKSLTNEKIFQNIIKSNFLFDFKISNGPISLINSLLSFSLIELIYSLDNKGNIDLNNLSILFSVIYLDLFLLLLIKFCICGFSNNFSKRLKS